jgi:hypothetical protein
MHRAPTLVKILALATLHFYRNYIIVTGTKAVRDYNEMVQAVSRAIRASGCYNCRLSLLRAFTTISSIPLHSTYQPFRALKHPNEKRTRLFSSFPQHATISPGIAEDEEAPLAEKEDGEEAFNAQSSETAAVPWYLQVELPSKPPRPLSERQRIPDLPESPPKILEPLLQRISVDLGLDDLSLLDLRHLDPPPALGANLLMIIGTARSEKHLHVSADRLCRWLRSEYKLRPDADGLLGRNELKLKMRRKNRRAKLLGSGTSNDDMDDGMRTGWVCVNIGTVESDTSPGRIQTQKEDFVGFGRQTEGVRIVVQMLVEKRREELDLEKLWNGIAKRRSADELPTEENTGVADGKSDTIHNSPVTSAAKPHDSISVHSSTAFAPISIQSRSFHTGLRRFSPALDQISSTIPSSAPIFSTYDQPSETDPASINQQVVLLLESGEHDAAFSLVVANRSSVAEFQNDGWRKHLLSWLRNYIENTPSRKALKDLGRDWKDHSSTPFLRCFYHTISRFPSNSEWEFQIWLHCFARRLGHVGYTLEGLSILFHELQISGSTIPSSIHLKLLRSTLQPRGDLPGAAYSRADNDQQEFAVQILQDMFDRTGNILTEDIFVALQESLASYPEDKPAIFNRLSNHPNAAVATYDLPVLEIHRVPDASDRVNMLMSTLQVRVLNDGNRMRLMILYAKQYKWVDFWRLWRSIAREGEPRSPTLWALMFKLVAKTKHQKGCMTVLRSWIPDMDREEPQVKLEGEVLEGVKACLAVADPSVNQEMLYDPEARGEWINLWRRCLGIV